MPVVVPEAIPEESCNRVWQPVNRETNGRKLAFAHPTLWTYGACGQIIMIRVVSSIARATGQPPDAVWTYMRNGSLALDVAAFLMDFQDHLAPTLDTYEQALYLYIFRHSRLIGLEQVVLGFKTARSRLATGVGERGKPMGEHTCREKLRSLQGKGCLELLTVERQGTRMHLRLPREIPGLIRPPAPFTVPDLEAMDFFTIKENRPFILMRENHKCFYCLHALTTNNYVIEHVVSRPAGDSSYRNVVAACRQCNNRKNDSDVEDFFRVLYRDGLLSGDEFQQRLAHLQRLRAGELRPPLAHGPVTAENRS